MSSGSSSKLVETTFNTNPDNELAVVDVYESESSGIENSFQDAYHSVDSAIDDIASIGKSALSDVNGLLNDINGAANNINSVLSGLANGNLNSLFNLTGGSLSNIKQLSDAVNGAINTATGIANKVNSTINNVTNVINNAASAVNSISNLGNGLKGGLNNRGILNRISDNIPLGKQIKTLINNVGKIDSAAQSLEHALGRASNMLGGDKSSLNTIANGTKNKAPNIIKPTVFDTKTTSPKTKEILDKIKSINQQVSSAISSLPVATQEALVRGFPDEYSNNGLVLGDDSGAIVISPQATCDVIRPLNDIISCFTGNEEYSPEVQDTGAISTLISGVANVANSAGLKNTFSTITKNITNKDVIIAAAKPLVMRAVEQGDLDTIIDISKSKAGNEVKRFAPSVIKEICYNVSRPHDMGQQDFAPYYNDVKRAFNAIDPTWMEYRTNKGQSLVNGASINSNHFICDIIEASLNNRNNPLLTKLNRQNVSSKNIPITKLTITEEQISGESFADEMEKAIDKINSKSYEDMLANGETAIIIKKDVIETPVIIEEEEQELNLNDEKYLLLASVFVDNSVESEIEKHFEYLHERFKLMGTYDR